MEDSEKFTFMTVVPVHGNFSFDQTRSFDLSSFGISGLWLPIVKSLDMAEHMYVLQKRIFSLSHIVRVRLLEEVFELEWAVVEVIHLDTENTNLKEVG
ncbi:MAG: hypothetical protein P1V18_04365 [Candidatus Gracilibacteria bacterium]|nr:hypothetical protein [Candidatus Gracilibacteria bacterium]